MNIERSQPPVDPRSSSLHADRAHPLMSNEDNQNTELTPEEINGFRDTLFLLQETTKQENDLIPNEVRDIQVDYRSQISRRILTPTEELIVSNALYRTNHEITTLTHSLLDDSIDDEMKVKTQEKIAVLQTINEEAREQMILRNLKLASSIAKNYSRLYPRTPTMDIIQEANIGLMKAVQDFNPTLGYRFSTYATFWIRQSVSRFIANNDRTIRVPIHVHVTISKIRRTASQIELKHGREATHEEIATELGEDVETIANALDVHRTTQTLSLNMPIEVDDGGSGTEFGDMIVDPHSIQVEQHAQATELTEQLNKMFEELTEREQDVIRSRYGLETGKPQTLHEIAEHYGLSRERIRQIEVKALSKLKHPTRGSILRKHLE